MPLHPQVAEFLRQYAEAELPNVWEMPLDDARQMMAEASRTFGQGPEMAEVHDLAIPGPAGEIPSRVYRPRSESDLPVVAYYHGGGWVLGGLETHDALSRHLAQESGCVVVAVDYRLAPEHRFPVAAEDAYAAVCWLPEHAGEFGGLSERLAVCGDSAGGNLAAVCCLLARDRGGPTIAAQGLIYPIADCRFDTGSYQECAQGYMLTREAMRWYWDQYAPDGTQRTSPMASPLRAENLSGLPPTLVQTAEYDVLRDEGEAFAGRLNEAGVAVQLTRYDGMIHGFVSRQRNFDAAGQAVAEVGAFLKRHLIP